MKASRRRMLEAANGDREQVRAVERDLHRIRLRKIERHLRAALDLLREERAAA